MRITQRGWLVALLNHYRLPLGRFVPEPWPRAEPDNTLRVPFEVSLAA